MERWRLPVLGLLLGSVLHAATAPACLWDRDTRAMERQRFPSVLEVITGKFLRHSDTAQQQLHKAIRRLQRAQKVK